MNLSEHLLSITLFWPLLGGLIVLAFPKQAARLIAWFTTAWFLAGFLISLPLWFRWDRVPVSEDGFRFVEQADWIPAINVQYYLGIDGISLLLILLTTLIGFLAAWCSWTAIQERRKEYYFFLLLLQTGMLGAFMALDFFLFYVFWELMLVPMYFLIGVWGSKRRLYAAIKFFLYTLLGSVLMLLGIIYLYTQAGTFEVPRLYDLFGDLLRDPVRSKNGNGVEIGDLSPCRVAPPDGHGYGLDRMAVVQRAAED